MASKEANKAKYQYNKKYVERYWERRAQRENGQTVTETSKEKSVSVSFNDRELLPELEKINIECSVSRNGDSDEKYIKALEDANKSYRSENKRLIKLLIKYQEIIKLGLITFNQKYNESK